MITKLAIQTRYILSVPVTALLFKEQISLILKWARKRESRYVCVANVHMIMEAYWNSEFASVLEQADLVTPDGMPLVQILKNMGIFYQDRVAGMELFLSLCELAPQCNLKVFFLGSDQQTLEKIRKRITQEFPDLQIAGMKPLPFGTVEELTNQETIDEINQSGAGLVFVCLGCPKQEHWMKQHQGKIQAVMLGFGAVFPMYAGIHQRAPFWLQNLCLEWLYRLKQEPKRLWHRYSRTIPPFLWLATWQLLRLKIANLLLRGHEHEFENLYFDYLYKNFKNKSPSMSHQKIGEILVRQKVISPDKLASLLEKQKNDRRRLGELLVQEKLISQMELDYYLLNQKIYIMPKQKIVTSEKINRLLAEQYYRHQGDWPIVYSQLEHQEHKETIKDEHSVVSIKS